MENKTIETVNDIPEGYEFISDSQDVQFIKELFFMQCGGFCDSFFVKIDSTGTEYESIYGITGIVPTLDKRVYKIL